MSTSLQVLADHRDALLLAEVGALIHDLGKLSQEFISDISSDAPDRHYAVLRLHKYCPLEPIVSDFESASEPINEFLLSRLTDQDLRQQVEDSWNCLKKKKVDKCIALVKQEIGRCRHIIVRKMSSRDEIEANLQRENAIVLAITERAIQDVKSRNFSPSDGRIQELELWCSEATTSGADKQTVDRVKEFMQPILEHYRRLNLEEQVPIDFFPDGLEILLSTHIIFESGCECKLADFIEMHHEYHGNVSPLLYHLIAYKKGVDGLDSWIDKGQVANEGQQKPDKPFIATAFGYEHAIGVHQLKCIRYSYTNILMAELELLQNAKGAEKTQLQTYIWKHLLYGDIDDSKGLREETRKAFSKALGETRRAANDVSLWDHSYSVASLYKSTLAKILIDGWQDPDNIRWRILRVNFDVLDLYAKAVKIADLLAYKKAVADACEAVKQLVEVDYPLGNEVYRDTTGIYFTYPDLDLFPELKEEIRQQVEAVDRELAPRIAVETSPGATAGEQLKRLLSDAREQARHDLAQPFAPDNLSVCWAAQWENLPEGQWEVCPVCRLRPMEESKDACETCQGRRASRVDTWLASPQTTIWMDEIADANGRVALFVGRFGLDDWLSGDLVQTMLVKADSDPTKCVPKNPSPARLRRVWETCQRFWTETSAEILRSVSPGSRLIIIPDDRTGWQENVPYDGTIGGKPISLLWREDAKQFVTISNLQWVDGTIEENQEIVVSEPDTPARTRSFKVQGVMPAMGAMGQYNPTLTLLESPGQFMALAPAADAPAIAEQIRAAYVEQFGKVQNRLPLFLGLVFFPRKTPLAAVLEAGRRMGEWRMKNEEWRIERCVDKRGIRDGQDTLIERTLVFDNRCKMTVKTVMGDDKTPDVWYPYFELVGTPEARHTHRFECAGQWWVHVKDLQSGETVRVTPSHFAYLFLEHTAQRFRFDPEKDGQYLDELKRLKKMWADLCCLARHNKLKDTTLQNIAALLKAKAAAWGRQSDELRHLAETTLKDAGLYKRKDKDGNYLLHIVTPDDVMSGRFDRCLELYHHILKERVKQEA